MKVKHFIRPNLPCASEFPGGCQEYAGARNGITPDCYTSIWLEAGCTRNGIRNPENLTVTETSELNILNLRYVS